MSFKWGLMGHSEGGTGVFEKDERVNKVTGTNLTTAENFMSGKKISLTNRTTPEIVQVGKLVLVCAHIREMAGL